MTATDNQRATKRQFHRGELSEEEAIKQLQALGLAYFCAASYLSWPDEDRVS